MGLLTAVITLLLLAFSNSVLAKEASESAETVAKQVYLGKSLIHPAHPLYFLKKIREILELKFAPSQEIQAIRYLEFAQRRVREARSLVEAKRADLIAPTLEHYIFNLHKALDITDLKNEAKVRQLTEIVSIHVRVLDNLYPQIEDQSAKRSIRTTMFKLSEWNQKFQERLTPAFLEFTSNESQSLICDFLAKEAQNSSLNEVEREVLQERMVLCLQGLK